MKSNQQHTRSWRKRSTLILVVLVFAIATALVLGSFDRSGTGQSEEDFAPARTTPSDATLEAFRVGPEQMESGDFLAAINTYEDQLSRLDEVPAGNMSSYFGDLGLAHFFQGQTEQEAGQSEKAREHYVRAAFMFEQAADTATHGVIVSVAEFYRTMALFSAKEYGLARDVGENFLRFYPEVAIAAEYLPGGATAMVKEILAVSYHTLAEQPNVASGERANVLRENGLRYAEEAIAESPDRVIQPYYYTGVAASNRGDLAIARERLQVYVNAMRAIPQVHWDEEDLRSVDEAEQLLNTLW